MNSGGSRKARVAIIIHELIYSKAIKILHKRASNLTLTLRENFYLITHVYVRYTYVINFVFLFLYIRVLHSNNCKRHNETRKAYIIRKYVRVRLGYIYTLI